MEGQNNLYDYVLQENLSNWQCLLNKVLNQKKLSVVDLSKEMRESVDWVLEYFCYGHFFASQQWIKSGMKIPPDTLATILDAAASKGFFASLDEILNRNEKKI
ncbi:hypothetical protein [Oscillibacter sp.]|uniref:hypothetical protein n=1 Tax=Oscillibacter sp. TaxID=1945593 RepID=UPI003391688E